MTETDRNIGPYRLVEPLGEGGMGVVWLAEHRDSGQLTALKTVRLPDASLLQGLRREVRALARLDHPGIVRILDEGVEDGLPWYAMDLLEGASLRLWWQRLARSEPATARPEPEPPSEDWWSSALDLAPQAHGTSPDQAHAIDPAPHGRTRRAPPRRRAAATRHRTAVLSLPAAPSQRAAVPIAPGPRPSAAGGRLPQLLRMMRQLCGTLAYLHGEGLVHRDLKPGNILIVAASSERRAASSDKSISSSPAARSPQLAASPRPVLIDFGLLSESGAGLRREAIDPDAFIAGTAAYMAPEQIRGELLDARADLYALGCILFELLTGRRCFDAPGQAQLLEQHLHRPPPRPSDLVQGVPLVLEELILRLLRKDPRERFGHALDVAAVLASLGAGDEPLPGPAPRPCLYRPSLGGRRAEIERLRTALSDLRHGRGGGVLVEGASGIGKTRLLLELAREAALGKVQVLAGESPAPTREGGSDALRPLRRPLSAIADTCLMHGLAETERLLGPRGRVLAVYVPALGALPGQERHPEPALVPPAQAQRRVCAALAATFAALAAPGPSNPHGHPLLVVLDDLQWADELTVAFLGHLAQTRAFAQQPVLIVGGTRPMDEPDGNLGGLAALAVTLERIELRPLDTTAVANMVGDMLALDSPPGWLSFEVLHRSGGNPFLAAEVLRAAVDAGLLGRDSQGRWTGLEPAGVALALPLAPDEVVRRRLAGLPAAAQVLVEGAAVVGREISIEMLHALTGIPPGQADAALDELVRRHVLEPAGPAAARFAHDALREAAYAGLPASRRATLHRAAAEAFETRPDRESLGAVLGHHWEQAGEPARAVEAYEPAARRAVASSAQLEAERLYRACLRLVEPASPHAASLHGLLAATLKVQGRMREAEDELYRALELARSLTDPGLLARLLLQLGTLLWSVGRADEARPFLDEALARFRAQGARDQECDVLGLFAIMAHQNGRLDEAEALYQQALELARETAARVAEARVLGNLAILREDQGRIDLAVEMHEQVAKLKRSLGDRIGHIKTILNLATALGRIGRPDEEHRLYLEALALSREAGHRESEGLALQHLGTTEIEKGRLDAGQQLLEKALERHREVQNLYFEAYCLDHLASVTADLGKWEEAEQLWAQAVKLQTQQGLRQLEGSVLRGLARLRRWQDQGTGRSGPLAEQAVSLLRQVQNGSQAGRALCERGHVRLAGGRSAEAELAELRSSPGKLGTGWALGQAVQKLERAQAAFLAGGAGTLVRGELPEDLPEPVRRRLGVAPP